MTRRAPTKNPRASRAAAEQARRDWEMPAADTDSTSERSVNLRVRVARRKLRGSEVLWVLERLSTTESAGMPLYRALGALARMQSGSLVGRRLTELQELMSEGRTLADAMGTRAEEWGPLTVALISAGEASGGLEEALRRAVAQMDARMRLRRKVRSALFYPAAVLGITVLLIGVLLLFVVPRFEKIYAELGSNLPGITKVVLALANQAPLALVLTLTAALASLIGIRKLRSTAAGRLRFDQIKLRVPYIGSLLDKAATARVASTLSGLLSAGVPLLDCLTFAAQAVGLRTHEIALEQARQRVSDGVTLSVALEETGRFPELMIQLITVGQETGALPTMMSKYSEAASEELSAAAENLTSLIEPFMMVVIGGVVGLFLIALYLPVIELGGAIGQ
jgi:type IV pilus assembly protein PilC